MHGWSGGRGVLGAAGAQLIRRVIPRRVEKEVLRRGHVKISKCHSLSHKTCSCPSVRYFRSLFWDDITIIWDEN